MLINGDHELLKKAVEKIEKSGFDYLIIEFFTGQCVVTVREDEEKKFIKFVYNICRGRGDLRCKVIKFDPESLKKGPKVKKPAPKPKSEEKPFKFIMLPKRKQITED